MNPDHTLTDPNYTRIDPDILMDHTLTDPGITITDPDHILTDPNYTCIIPDHTLTDPYHTLTDPDHTITDPDHILTDPNNTLIDPDQTLTDPHRILFHIGKNNTTECKPYIMKRQADFLPFYAIRDKIPHNRTTQIYFSWASSGSWRAPPSPSSW